MTTTSRPRPRAAARPLLLLATLLACIVPQPVHAQPQPEGEGAAALGVALRRLGTTQRVLMIAAHPDDENTALLAELALGRGADVAYLSLTRGEGGQNLIGPELQEALGIIRSEELLAARRLDGARQFFTRAVDFGFSRSAAETFRHWPRDSVAGDVVEIIRRFRPDIIVSVFNGTAADGHGQHQAAGLAAIDAFTAAADPARFPEQLARGLPPHTTAYLFHVPWRTPPDAALTVETGTLDPLFGRSHHQIAMRSRSRHRSQDMGQIETAGPQTVGLNLLAGELPPGARSLFAGLDTTLLQRATRAGADADVATRIAAYEQRVRAARAAFNPLDPSPLVPQLRDAIAQLEAAAAGATPELRFHIQRELEDARLALRLAAGIIVDAVADNPFPTAGETFELTLSVWNGGSEAAGVRALEPLLPAGWTATPLDVQQAAALQPHQHVQRRFRIHVPRTATPSQPYFLREERGGSLYVWTVDDTLRGAPFEPAPVRARAALDVGTTLDVVVEATHVLVDKAFGEIRRPLLVVEPASIRIDPALLVHASGRTAPHSVTVTVRSAAAQRIEGRVILDLPHGWRAEPADARVVLARRGESHTTHFTLTPAATAAADDVISARFITTDGTFDSAPTLIDYEHIRPHATYAAAATRIAAFPVRIAADLRVGYIEGAGDEGASALRQLGATVELLDATALASADLARYDAIVTGIRAYEVRPDLITHNQRLIDYASRGGTVIVQYNKYELVEHGLMPFPATMARPHGRVTDPAAPVRVLDAQHPLLAAPNRITAADFDGWVQERGLYFLHTFDSRYTPLLAMADEGQDPLQGGLVAARVGRGWYVYTGLALFRQLPAGVPGAYRLLANLVSLGRTSRSD